MISNKPLSKCRSIPGNVYKKNHSVTDQIRSSTRLLQYRGFIFQCLMNQEDQIKIRFKEGIRISYIR